MKRLHGQVAIVTGGARGIGRAIAERFSAEGAMVLIGDLDEAAAAATAADLSSRGASVVYEQIDIALPEDAERLVRRAIQEFGRIDLLVNNAGILEVTELLEIRPDEWQRVLSVNTVGMFGCLQAVARRIIEQGDGGAIVNVASVVGRHGHPYLVTYGASKAAVVNITRSAARAFAPHGVRVNAICPGIIDTEMWEIADARYAQIEGLPLGEPRRRRVAQVPLGRSGTPADVAGVAAFLASADAAYVSGQAINVCGATYLD